MNDPDAYQNHFIVIMGHSGHSFNINFLVEYSKLLIHNIWKSMK